MRSRAASRGMTMLEVMVAVGVLSLVAVLIHSVIDSLSRSKRGEAMRVDRAHEGRQAMERIVRDLSAAYLSVHVPASKALATGTTAFIGRHSGGYDRVDFTAFAHMRTRADARESDQAEVGYFVMPNLDSTGTMDLVRREQTPIDLDPKKGGTVDVVAEDVEEFELSYLDPTTARWTDSWDSTQVTGQPGRVPLEVRVHLSLKGVGPGPSYSFTTKLFIPTRDPLSFGVAR